MIQSESTWGMGQVSGYPNNSMVNNYILPSGYVKIAIEYYHNRNS